MQDNNGNHVIPRPRRFLILLSVVCAIVALDLLTKSWVFSAAGAQIKDGQVVDGRTIEVIPGCFDLQCVMNQGAFSGWFGGHFSFLVAVSAVALLAIVGYAAFGTITNGYFVLALAFIAGGTAGNLYDRLVFGAVRDFFRFFIPAFNFTWPNFNVADSSICVGVGLWFAIELVASRKAKQAKAKKQAA